MTDHYGTIEVKKMRGKMTIIGLGKTPRGQRYIKRAIQTEATSSADPKFKAEQTAAVEKLFA